MLSRIRPAAILAAIATLTSLCHSQTPHFATVVEREFGWKRPNRAEGPPPNRDCDMSDPDYAWNGPMQDGDGPTTGWLFALEFDDFVLNGQAATKVEVAVLARYDMNEHAWMRFKALWSGSTNTQFVQDIYLQNNQPDGNCYWQNFDVTHLEPDGWTEAELESMVLQGRRKSGAGANNNLRIKAFRIRVTYGPDCDGDGIADIFEPDCNHNGVPDDCDLIWGTSEDCNHNGVPDECDIASGYSSDCNGNGVPDECDPDCNQNQVPDDCDIWWGNSQDCNHNGVPDECDISHGDSDDCNDNGVPDECDPDCDGDGIPDDCDDQTDCNGNGVLDHCEDFNDCNGNGVPDECDPDCDGDGIPDDCDDQTDCNGNGIPDHCDIANGTSQDCDSDGVPDECEPDCDGDGVPDDCDDQTDCNGNGIPDHCDIANGTSGDCDGDGVPDECEDDCDGDGLPDDCEDDCDGDGTPDECDDQTDCNGNGEPDHCDIASGKSGDCDNDGVPDECEDDCDENGVPDDCEFMEDCNENDIPDRCETDCNGNGIPDDCDIASGFSEDANGDGIPDECSPFEEFCLCPSNSPCGNEDPEAGCVNATGTGARLSAVGSASVAADDLYLKAFPVVPNQTGLFFMGSSQVDGVHFGNGLRCVGAPMYRYRVGSSGPGGILRVGPVVGLSHEIFPDAGKIQPGSTWHFQAWFRDPGGPCGSGFNTSSALKITFEP